MSVARTHAAHMPNADESTVRNRKKTLKERFNNLVDRLDCPGNQKVFHRQNVKSVIDELVQIAVWDNERKMKAKYGLK